MCLYVHVVDCMYAKPCAGASEISRSEQTDTILHKHMPLNLSSSAPYASPQWPCQELGVLIPISHTSPNGSPSLHPLLLFNPSTLFPHPSFAVPFSPLCSPLLLSSSVRECPNTQKMQPFLRSSPPSVLPNRRMRRLKERRMLFSSIGAPLFHLHLSSRLLEKKGSETLIWLDSIGETFLVLCGTLCGRSQTKNHFA